MTSRRSAGHSNSLTGKAQQAYTALPPNAENDYDEVKAAILRQYNINEETYRQRFRSLRIKEREAARELLTRLTDLVTRWTRECSSKEEILDLIIKEWLLRMLPEDVRIWVNERKTKNSQEAGELAENYLQARSTTEPKRNQEIHTTKCPSVDCMVIELVEPTKVDTSSVKPPEYPQARLHYLENMSCFKCNEKGHIAANCPRKSFYCNQKGDLCPQYSSLHVDAPSDGCRREYALKHLARLY